MQRFKKALKKMGEYILLGIVGIVGLTLAVFAVAIIFYWTINSSELCQCILGWSSAAILFSLYAMMLYGTWTNGPPRSMQLPRAPIFFKSSVHPAVQWELGQCNYQKHPLVLNDLAVQLKLGQ